MNGVEQPVTAAVPADLNTPDKVLYGLTARQAAILAGAGVVLWLAYRALSPLVPAVAIAVAGLPVVAVAATVALGRRDAIGMDRWLAAALKAARSPHRLVAAPDGVATAPAWAPAAHPTGTVPGAAGAVAGALAPLRLPARAVTGSGVVDIDGGRVAVTAATTVNFDLRAAGEQHALLDGMSRWLNSLSGPVQVVICSRRVDMHAYADQVEDRLDQLPHPALAGAAAGYASFLRWLGEDRDPLDRRVLIAHRVSAGSDTTLARRQAEQTARALTGLGCATRVLDGGGVTDALVGACDPWRYVGTGHATPHAIITGPADGSLR